MKRTAESSATPQKRLAGESTFRASTFTGPGCKASRADEDLINCMQQMPRRSRQPTYTANQDGAADKPEHKHAVLAESEHRTLEIKELS